MLFDVQAALAELLSDAPATIATPATNGAKVAEVADVAAPPAEFSSRANVLPFAPPPSALASPRDGRSAFSHGASVTGLPRTWTGRVVSLEEWRTLTEWQKHGPAGRLFCGLCQSWVKPGDCPHTEGGAA